MSHGQRIGAFAGWLALVLIFILVTGTELPGTVASHFGASGAADAFMPRNGYLALMCFFGAAMPAFMVFGPRSLIRGPARRINLPNRDYWLAPERIERTRRILIEQMALFGALLALLIGFAHWEVVQANLGEPPHLDSRRFLFALAVFVFATAAWVFGLYARFRRIE